MEASTNFHGSFLLPWKYITFFHVFDLLPWIHDRWWKLPCVSGAAAADAGASICNPQVAHNPGYKYSFAA